MMKQQFREFYSTGLTLSLLSAQQSTVVSIKCSFVWEVQGAVTDWLKEVLGKGPVACLAGPNSAA